MIKRSKIKDFKLTRYSKPASCMKLKEGDEVICCVLEKYNSVFLTTNSGYGLSFATNDIPEVGVKASGVKAMSLKDDIIVSISNFDYNEFEFISVITDKGTGKRVRLSELPISTRARRGLLLLREVKTNPYRIVSTFITSNKNHLGIKTEEITMVKVTELPIMDRYSTGSQISKKQIKEAFVSVDLTTKEDLERGESNLEVPKKDSINLKEIDDKLMTIDDFLK